jgi:glycosyltransferase involved in cell wall biosynthesis
MKRVLEQNPATFLVAGDGPEIQVVRDCFGGMEQVRFLGQLSYERYASMIQASDIAVFPYPESPVYRAKCSARIIDYMAAGKAVVTTAVGQNSEYIRSDESGILVSPENEVEFITAVTKLLLDIPERVRLGKNARQRVAEHFLWSGRVTDRCETVYRTVGSRQQAT